MPIEVREIIIRAQVEPSGGDTGESSGGGSNGTVSQGSLGEEEMQNIIAMCAEEVLSILKRQTER